LDHSFEVDLNVVKERAVRGIAILIGRGFFLNAVAQVSLFFLLAFLSPEEIGLFWIVSAVVGFLIFFSDVGLAAALIQKREKPTVTELRTTFLVQQALVITLLFALFLASPLIGDFYNLSNEGRLLLFALGAGLFLSSLKSIPSVLLERSLRFGRFVLPELLESLVYSISVVYFAWQGFGVRSFAYAVLLRGIVGVVSIYVLQPWMPGLAFSKEALRGLLRFGIPYQANNLLSLIKDRGVTLALGAVVGNRGVGFFGTAERVSQMPLRFFLDPTTKVSFPAFSRMQEHREQLSKSVTRAVMFITFLVYPVVVGILVTAPVIFEVIPNRFKEWEPVLVPLFFLSVNVLFAAPTTLLTSMLMAIGKIKVVSKLVVMWTVLTLIFVPGLGHFFGINGAAAGNAIVSSTSVIAIYIARKLVPFSIYEGIIKVLLTTAVMGVVVYALRVVLEPTLANLIVMIAAGGVTYTVSSYLIIGPSIVADARKIAKNFFG